MGSQSESSRVLGSDKLFKDYRMLQPLFTNTNSHANMKYVRMYSTDSKSDACSSPKLTHIDSDGAASMVEVKGKPETARVAVAKGVVYLGEQAFQLVKENKIKKGDVLTTAQLAGIMASKSTSTLIPLCHNIPITRADVQLKLNHEKNAVEIIGTVSTVGRTGVEMEALTAVSVAALTVYDMCKAISYDIVIGDIQLICKSGGRSGHFSKA